MSQPPRNRQGPRPAQNRTRPQPQRVAYNRNAPPKRDPFPYIMGGVIGALVVGLMIVVFLIGQNSGGEQPPSNTVPPPAGTVPNSDTNAPTAAVDTSGTPPRMEIKDFKALYDSANRPIVLDVRAKQAYDEGHIKGAINIPEVEIDGRLAELPKDKLIVAYCQ